MIKIENHEVVGWEHSIRGMRNPKNSWERSDSFWTYIEDPETLQTANFEFFVGDADKELMMKLAKGGPVHAKYRRMILLFVDITAPLYWWKEFDTYKVGTVANSCSTMHKIMDKEFELDDFSHDRMTAHGVETLLSVIKQLNYDREAYLLTKDVDYWDDLIQLLPSSYNQKRTILMNYESLSNIYKHRHSHKLAEWRELCRWMEDLPHSDLFTGVSEYLEGTI